MKSTSVIFLLSTSALCFAVSPAFAQERGAQPLPSAPAKATAVDSEDIIVTATRVETNLQNTPVAITALSSDTLKQRNVSTLVDVGSFVPSVSIGGRGGLGTIQGSVAIRGIGVGAPDSAPAVGIYIDDVYYPATSGNLLGLFDAARIEVLRGPQGTLFGRNTIAGAIQFISEKPKVGKFSGFAEASAGYIDSYQFTGAVNVPLGNRLAVRVSGQVTQHGGYVHDLLNNIDRGQDYTEQGRVQLRWTPTERLTIDLKGETLKSNGNGRPTINSGLNTTNATAYKIATGAPPFNTSPPGLPVFFRENRPYLPSYNSPAGSYDNAGFNYPDFLQLRYNAGNAVIAYNLTDDIRFKSISAYSFTKARVSTDFDDTPLNIITVDRGTVRNTLFTQEVQLTGNSLNHRLHWTAGVYYYDSNETTTGFTTVLGNLPATPNPESKIKNESIAGYGQATFDIAAGISASAGVRYSQEDITAIYTAGRFPSTKIRYTDTSPSFGLNWQADRDVLLYAKAAKGFRAGGYHADVAFTNGILPFGPETAWTYEAGARLSLFDHRLRFNPTIYLTDWKNIQFVYVVVTPTGTVAATQNAGDARLKGAELESQFSVTKNFQLTGSFSYLDARYRRLAPPTAGTVPIQLTLNSPLARAPEFKYTIGGRYQVDLHDGGSIVASANYAWTDRQRSSVPDDQQISMPAYGLLSARIEFAPAGKNFTFALYGTNLTDKYYLLDGINFQSSTGVAPITPGRPREYGASAKIRF